MSQDVNCLSKKKWYAIYTRSRFEKKVYQDLQKINIECFLPIQKVLKQWSDRKKWIEEPLFRSYIFVRVSENEYYEVLKVNGVQWFVTSEGHAIPVREKQIEILKKILSTEIEFEVTHDDLEPGADIEIISGSLKGLTGRLIRYKGKQKVVINIETINHSIILNVGREYIKKNLHNQQKLR